MIDLDAGFEEGRQYGRSKHSGGQIRDDYRVDYDPERYFLVSIVYKCDPSTHLCLASPLFYSGGWAAERVNNESEEQEVGRNVEEKKTNNEGEDVKVDEEADRDVKRRKLDT